MAQSHETTKVRILAATTEEEASAAVLLKAKDKARATPARANLNTRAKTGNSLSVTRDLSRMAHPRLPRGVSRGVMAVMMLE
jgi:hypothetical protein